MDKAIGNLLVTLSFDSSKFNDGVTAAQRQLRNFERATKNAGNVARATGYSMDASKLYVNNMKETYKALNHTLAEQKKQYDALGEAHGKDSAQRLKLGAQMELTKAKIIELNKEYDRELTNIAKANSRWYQGFGMVKNAGSAIDGFGQKVQSLGNQWSRASLAASVAGGLLIKTAMDFETGMINVQKTTNLADADLDKLGNTLRQMAKETPIAVAELQNLAMAGGQLGIARDKLADFSLLMAKIGTATDITSESAAQMFARFGNITNLPFDKFENLGSSLVNLGNNIAAAESEIMEMAMGLAGTLSSLGVSNDEILGLSGAMAALGIASERGASSMSKFFVELETMVQSGSEDLWRFAEVAGMSVDDFSSKFKSAPTEAFTAFINGLKKIEESGGSIVNTLDELGINEVRLRDTILRLAKGNDTLTESLRLSKEGWQANSALQAEYENKLKSTASQWAIFKNKLVDLAITAGNALLPVLTDLMDNADGMIEGVKEFIGWIDSWGDGFKKFAVKATLAGVAFGPILSALGTMVSLGGKLITIGGSVGQFFGLADVARIKKTFGTLEDGTKVMVTMGTSTAKTGGILSKFSVLLGKINPWVIAGTVALGIGALAWKLWGEEAWNAYQRAKEFPDIKGITEEQAKSLRETADAFSTIDVALEVLGANSTTHTGKVTGAISSIIDEIEKINTEKIDSTKEKLKDMPEAVRQAIQGSVDESLKAAEGQIQRAKEIEAEIAKIYETANSQNRQLSQSERVRVEGLTAEIKRIYAESLGADLEQQQAIYRRLSDDLGNVFKGKELEKALRNRNDKIKQYLADEKTALEETKSNLKEMLESGMIDETAYQKGMQKAEEVYADSSRRLQISAVKNAMQLAKAMKVPHDELVSFIHNLTGLDHGQIAKFLQAEVPSVGEAVKNMVNEIDKLPAGVQQSANKFNKAIAEFATNLGKEVDKLTNEEIQQFISEAEKLGLTWNDLELLSKEANLDSNVKKIIEEILATKSEWDFLTFEEKVLKLQTEGLPAVQDMLKAVGIDWEALNPEAKQIIAEGIESGIKLSDLLVQAGVWNQLSFAEQTAVLVSEGYDDLQALLEEYNVWQYLPDETKEAIINSEVKGKDQIDAFIQLWDNTEFRAHAANVDVNAADAKQKIAEVITLWAVQAFAAFLLPKTAKLDASDNASAKIDTVQEKADALDNTDTNSDLNASDNASGTINTVSSRLWRLDGREAHTYIYTHHRTTGRAPRFAHGTNYHMGGLAVLGDGGKNEPFLTPQGTFGVSPNRDTLYDLPAGTKVWSSVAKFMNDARYNARLLSYLPRFADGTDRSFLDGLSKISVPSGLSRRLYSASHQGESNNSMIVHEGDTVNLSVTINTIGSKLTQQQSDSMIDTIMESAKRWGKKHNKQVVIGG